MNLKQLSQMLGLSQTTISRALNGYPEVNEETRQRVAKAAAETGYRPNRAALRLATGKAGSLGLVMPISPDHSSDIHFAEFQSGLAETCLQHEFHFVIIPAHPQAEEQAIRGLVGSGAVDAFYLAYLRANDPRIAMAKSLSVPFIIHGRSQGIAEDYPYLDIDNEGAFRQATDLMIGLGHRRFALLNGPADLDFALRRLQGTQKALAAVGLTLAPEAISHTLMTDEWGYRKMSALLHQPERPTAVLCASTVLALGAVRAINDAGLTVGQDISLVAHDDDLPLLKPEHFRVPLTTTRSSLRDAGRRVAQRLIADIAQPPNGPPLQEIWQAELVIRASTGPAPGK
ncbi:MULTISPECIES: LacI family DNA-binding transcriptional regulator [Rhizobium/Agrobacterium group]|uniref:LacI family DNA-binding transcriptional regulator n=1 Tax=Rhizobium/Agrobacterium group TaxID=227290 RepID=UPI000B3F969E|nr:substrate-binding domain-containing protein [Allorhizobium ampelinum]MVA73797.1 LacI family DNA-binding transcriptional regulator [Agrobacterium vitis]MCF1484649.1 LacI family transcriptional regulator [Allorhizobium ampelinum]NSZ41716.1 LacI family transcriptional regulator [Agrobacterium vitis]NTA25425.1 LacI family transcriptional regulator [Allorhizobium ampelinum]OVE96770.1 transcriptional regulator [Allorhizobium ampelinum]